MRSIYLILVVSVAVVLAEPVYENTFCLQQKCPYDGDFRCKTSGRCIRPWSVCDRNNHCEDGSDEENCGTPNFGCYGYLCDNRTTCLSYSHVCNGYAYCADGSDEGYCLYRSCPYNGDYKCNDGRCLRSSRICDGYSNCASGEDEQNCDYSKPCPYNGLFRCNTGECINSEYVCDRYNDCRDGLDEINCTYRCPYNGDVEYYYDYDSPPQCYRSYQFCTYWMYRNYYYYDRHRYGDSPNCSTFPCPYEGDYRCPSSGVCTRSYEVCDGSNTCVIDEDEENCTSLACPYNTWWCGGDYGCYSAYSICYNSLQRQNYFCAYNCSASCGNSTQVNSYIIICNGIDDCADGSDETDCYNRTCLADDDFRCESSGACIRRSQVCDGLMHCSDGSDEFNCTSRNCYFPGDMKCRDNGTCIHSDMICNEISDCMDGSDEENCGSRPCPYSGDRRCKTSQACIRADKWCNKRIDCMDESDEEDCYDMPCRYIGDFRCAYNGYCIRGYQVCDGYEHCLDGSDEGMNYCPEVFTMGVHWERTVTKTTNTHKCSDIHPSFKLTDVITRECLKNRTWAPVNISQCVMSGDSPVVMIVSVSLDTTNISLVRSKEDMIIQEMSERIIDQPVVHVEIIQSVNSADVSLKMTYELNTFNSTELIENVTYDMNLTTFGNLSVTTTPQLTIFESTDVCQCPASVTSSTVPIGINSSESFTIVSVCSGQPCEYSFESNFTSYQCGAPFAGDGVICGKDSDEDGYPDMALKCNDSHCTQDNCPTVYNPKQDLEACKGIEGDDDDDGLSTATVAGVTFALTLIVSISCTLLIVYIVYKIKQPAAKTDISTIGRVVTDVSLPRDATIKGKGNNCYNDDENYEYPEDFNSETTTVRYQRTPSTKLQSNPAYGMERPRFEENADQPVYENLK